MPTSRLVLNQEELLIELRKRSNSRIVVKPIAGSQGDGVLIGYAHELIEAIPDNYITPCIVQEFIDSSVGIPCIVEALHDIRVVMMNSEPTACYVRVPAKGSYVANVSLGASHRVIDTKSIPSDALKIIQVIDREFSKHGSRLYSVDMCNSPNGYKLIEINSQPGMWSSSTNGSFEPYNKKMAQFLIDLI
jgi:glutathione synthase/RimK-type ligase-like ATP-grasp enzyme